MPVLEQFLQGDIRHIVQRDQRLLVPLPSDRSLPMVWPGAPPYRASRSHRNRPLSASWWIDTVNTVLSGATPPSVTTGEPVSVLPSSET